jgi:hypothetical protein
MCGIAGFYCFGTARPDQEIAKKLFVGQEARGRSSAGVAYLGEDKEVGQAIFVAKNAVKATELAETLGEAVWGQIVSSPIALFHARQMTKGSEKDNVNNHPVTGLGWAVIHNGHVSNDDDLFAFHKAERFAAVDTAAIPLALSYGVKTREENEPVWMAAARGLSSLDGAGTIAAWNEEALNELLIFRFGHNKLFLVYEPGADILYWSSDQDTMYKLPSLKVGGVNFLTAASLEEHEGLHLTRENRITRFKVEMRPYRPTRVYSTGTTTKPSGLDVTSDRFRWTRYDSTIPRPTPFDVLKPSDIRLYALNPQALKSHFKRQPATPELQKCVVNTGYGHWALQYNEPSDEILTEFRMRKATKKAMRKIFGQNAVLLEDMPVDDSVTAFFDRKLMYEGLWVPTEHISGVMHAQASVVSGAMCPICGAPTPLYALRTSKGKCELCNVTSLLPPGVL